MKNGVSELGLKSVLGLTASPWAICKNSFGPDSMTDMKNFHGSDYILTLPYLLWSKVGHGGVAKVLLAALQVTLEVDGESNGEADDADNGGVGQDVPLEGEVLGCVYTSTPHHLFIPSPPKRTYFRSDDFVYV